MLLRRSSKTAFATAISLNVIGHSLKCPSSNCASTKRSISPLMLSSVYSGSDREAASTVSAIISIACSRVKGSGPG